MKKFITLLLCVCFFITDVQAAVSANDTARVTRIFQNLIKAMGKNEADYTLEIADTAEINAFATFGNKIVVNTGIMNYLKNDSSLAFVIAHEIGHLESHHLIKHAVRNGVSSLFKNFFFKESRIYSGIDYFHNLYYSRDQERDADEYAVEVMNKAYCKTPGKLEFFQKMSEAQRTGKIYEYFSTHPLPSSRLEYLQADFKAAGCVV